MRPAADLNRTVAPFKVAHLRLLGLRAFRRFLGKIHPVSDSPTTAGLNAAMP